MKSINFGEGIEQIIREFELRNEWGRKVLEESENLPGAPAPQEFRRREDLRPLSFVTIDGEKARDFDDAIYVKKLPGGGASLWVSIADVSHYVSPGSHLDREALLRANSVYFPDRVIPMLPERLSNDLCSLVPGADRFTVTAELRFDETGERQSCRFYRSVIRSAARMTYREVKEALVDRHPEACRKYRPLLPFLEEAAGLAALLRTRRLARGSLDLDLPEPDIVLDLEEGGIEAIVRAERYFSHRMIEEFMISANEAVAGFFAERKIPALYRVHDVPPAEKIQALANFLHHRGIPSRLGRRVTPRELSGVLEKVERRPEQKLIHILMLRSLGQAVYATRNIGHFGLASTCYTHFTSPIRRYPDLIVHRILTRALEDPGKTGISPKELDSVARRCSEVERIGMKSEWACRDLAGAFLLQKRIGEIFEGIISGISKSGLFVELVPLFVEGMLPFRSLTDDYYLVRPDGAEAFGRKRKKKFRIGDPLRVRVGKVNLEKRWIDLELAN